MPMVTIGMPVYNDKLFLRKALDSIIAQSFRNFELIISDDNSTDGSSDICAEYAKKDDRITYIRQPENIGISKNMKYLLDKAKGEYFMWAADDDLWDTNFINTLLGCFKEKGIVSAFCPMVFIDEKDNVLATPRGRATDYSGNNSFVRLKKLIKIFDDSFGYGLFKRNEIKDVEFPIWWWINKKCAYNNIYPSLCFYLTKGHYVLVRSDKPLQFCRLKDSQHINHYMPFNNSFIRYLLSLILRKINLIYFSNKMIKKAGGSIFLIIKLSPFFFYYWFIIPLYSELNNKLK